MDALDVTGAVCLHACAVDGEEQVERRQLVSRHRRLTKEARASRDPQEQAGTGGGVR